VFLSLIGLMVFERVILFTSIIVFGYQPASQSTIFKYGAESAMGPWDWMVVALLGLLFAQLLRTWQAYKNKQTSWLGIATGSCNILMIALFAGGLAINWAFHNPLSPGAYAINNLATYPSIKSHFEEPDIIGMRQLTDDWEQLDSVTFRNTKAGLIQRTELIKVDFPIEHQRANYLARNPETPDKFRDRSITALHYYDLDWNLLTIEASTKWPIVKQKLQIAGKPAFDADGEVAELLSRYYKSRKRLFTYEEILKMVEASWEGVSLEPEPVAEGTAHPPNSSPE